MTYNQLSYEYIESKLEELGYHVIDKLNYKNTRSKVLAKDTDGYIVYVCPSKVINSGTKPLRFHKSNNYSIANLNHYSKINKLGSVCVSKEYKDCHSMLEFQCSCGNVFKTSQAVFISKQKNKCDKCSGYNNNITYDELKRNLRENGYELLISENDYKGITLTELLCINKNGYKVNVVYNSVLNGHHPRAIDKSNPYSIENINRIMKDKQIDFICISDSYIDNKTPLKFKCLRCGEVVEKVWINCLRNDCHSRTPIGCPYCDGRIESLHALVLKQIFLHEYPDTIVEEKSCVNPKTNKVMPTDIVNHRLKIAIEIQSQWHDFKDSQEKGRYKKKFWLDKGYSFYDPDIRDYSILEMCNLFFNIDKIPDYIKYDYSNKINIKKIQIMLNNGNKVSEIAKELNVSPHRIYDALGAKKLYYPKNYSKGHRKPIIQYDKNWNYIAEFSSVADAGRANDIKAGSIVSALYRGASYCNGFNWEYKDN